MTILIVDDDPTIVADIEALLELNGLSSVGVRDAATAEARIADDARATPLGSVGPSYLRAKSKLHHALELQGTPS